jgi:hypothetical protein
MNFAIFDIETRIDKALIQSVMYPHEDVTEEEAYQRFRQQIREERDSRSDFLPIAFHVPISIVVGNVTGDHALTAVEVLCAQDCLRVLAAGRNLSRHLGVLQRARL